MMSDRRRRVVRRRIITLSARILVFGGLALLIWQRIVYVAMGVPGATLTLVGTVLFAGGMMIVLAQLENALDRAEHERALAEYDKRAQDIRDSRSRVEGGK